MVIEPQKHRKNIGPDCLAKNRIVDDGKLKKKRQTMKTTYQNTLKIMKTRNYEETLENHEIQPKIVKNHNIEKHRQRWLSPNNRISSNGNVCPKNI